MVFSMRGPAATTVAWSPEARRFPDAPPRAPRHPRGPTTDTCSEARRAPKLCARLTGHEGPINAVVFSPEGTHVATGSADSEQRGAVRIWDTKSGQCTETMTVGAAKVTALAFSDDGGRIAAGCGDGTVRVFDAATGRRCMQAEGHGARISALAFSPDGKRVASGSWDGSVRIWNVETGAGVRSLYGHTGWITLVRYSPDGRHIATLSADDPPRLWNASDEGLGKELKGHDGLVRAVAFSPDSASVATSSSDGTVCTWDAETADRTAVLEGHSRGVTGVQFGTEAGSVVSTSDDGTLRLWDVAAQRCVRTERLVESGSPGALRWCNADAQSGDRAAPGPSKGLSGLLGSRNGSVLGVVTDVGAVVLWGASAREAASTLPAHGARLDHVALSPQGTHLICVDDGAYDARLYALPAALVGTTASSDGRRASSCRSPHIHSDAYGAAKQRATTQAADGEPLQAMRTYTALLRGEDGMAACADPWERGRIWFQIAKLRRDNPRLPVSPSAPRLEDCLRRSIGQDETHGCVWLALAEKHRSDGARDEARKAYANALAWSGHKPDVQGKAWQQLRTLAGDEPRRYYLTDEAGFVCDERSERDTSRVPSKSDATMVPTETLLDVARAVAPLWNTGCRILLKGPTGCGKTAFVRFVCSVTGSPYVRVNLSPSTELSDLVGQRVQGQLRYGVNPLRLMTDEDRRAIAEQVDAEMPEGLSPAQQVQWLVDAQLRCRWVDGPLVRAMREGATLLLDELNLAQPNLLVSLNNVLEPEGDLVIEQTGERVRPNEHFRIVATMNPTSYAARKKLDEAVASRFERVEYPPMSDEELVGLLRNEWGERIAPEHLQHLVAAHALLCEAAEQQSLGGNLGGTGYSLRHLLRVCARVCAYGEVSDSSLEDLLRRETEEVYLAGLSDADDIALGRQILDVALPSDVASFYDALDVHEDDNTFCIGDATIQKVRPHRVLGDTDFVLTPTAKKNLYRLAKAEEMGEHVGLLGPRAGGKNRLATFYAQIRGQDEHRVTFSTDTDNYSLIGSYSDAGFVPGPLLRAGDPDGPGGVLVLDELNTASSAITERLNSVLDRDRALELTERHGEWLRMHPQMRIIATVNPRGEGTRNRRPLSRALMDRLTLVHIAAPETVEEIEQIVQPTARRAYVPACIAHKLVALHRWITEQQKSGGALPPSMGEEPVVISLRQTLRALDQAADILTHPAPPGQSSAPSSPLLDAFTGAARSTYLAPFTGDNRARVLDKIGELRRQLQREARL